MAKRDMPGPWCAQCSVQLTLQGKWFDFMKAVNLVLRLNSIGFFIVASH